MSNRILLCWLILLLNQFYQIIGQGTSEAISLFWKDKQIHQVLFLSEMKILVFAGDKEVFTYINDGIIGDPLPQSWSNKTYLSDNPSVSIKGISAMNKAMACGKKHLVLFTEAGDLLFSYTNELKPFSPDHQCSLFEISEGSYFISYTLKKEILDQPPQWSYILEIVEIVEDFDKVQQLELTYSTEIKGQEGNIDCVLNDYIFCTYIRNNNFASISMTNTFKKKSDELIVDSSIPNSKTILKLNSTTAIFAMTSNQLKGKKLMYDGITLTDEAWVVFISKPDLVAFDVLVMSEFEIIFAVTSNEYVYYQKGFINYFQANVDDYLTLTIPSAKLTRVSFGLFSSLSVGMIVHDEGKKNNYLFLLNYFQCWQNMKPQIASTSGWDFFNIFDKKIDHTHAIKLGNPDSNIKFYDEVYTSVDVYKMRFASQIGGHFYYEYFLRYTKDSKDIYSSVCNITMEVCFPTCRTCSEYGTATYQKCNTCQDNYYKVSNIPNQCSTIELLGGKYYLDNNDQTLKECHVVCKTCTGTSDDDCEECEVGYFKGALNSNKCVKQCDYSSSYWYYDKANNNNYQCTNMLSCPNGYDMLFKETYQCLEQCKDGGFYQKNPNEKVCIVKCLWPENINIKETNVCVSQCPEDLFFIRQGFFCDSKCESYHYLVDGTKECTTTCKELFTDAVEKKCYNACPVTKKTNEMTKECVVNCETSPSCESAAIATFNRNCEQYCQANNINCDQYKKDNEAKKKELLNECKRKYYEDEDKCVVQCKDKFHDKVNMQCVTACPNDLYSDSINLVCDISCHWNLFLHLPNNSCIQNCTVHSLFNDHKTKKCESKCTDYQLHDSKAFDCIDSCPLSHPFNQSFNCVNDCNPLILDNTTNICVTSCNSSLFFEEEKNMCVVNCSNNNPFVNPTNRYCIPSCQSISYHVDIDNKTCVNQCGVNVYSDPVKLICYTKCPNDLFTDEDNFLCLTEDNCKNNKFVNKKTKKCVTDCKANLYYQDNKINECVTKCSGAQYQYKDTSIMICVDDCKANPTRYQDDLDMSCSDLCSSQQYKYNTDMICVSDCADHSLFSNDELMECSDKCGNNQYKYEDKQICTISCIEYSLFSDPLTMTCGDKCSGSQLKETENYLCLDVCPKHLFHDQTANECVAKCQNGLIGDPSTMLCTDKCPNDYQYINDNVCVNDCGDKRLNPKTNECVNQCHNPLFYYEDINQCIDSCPPSMFYTITSLTFEKQCVNVCPFLLYIESNKECVSNCPNDLFKHNNLCIPLCPSNTFIHPTKRECLTTCLPEYVNTLNRQCIKPCPSNMLLHKTECIMTCPNNTFTDKVIKECLDNCGSKYVDNITKECIDTCPSNSVIYEATCYDDKCPENTYKEANTNKCVKTCGSQYFNQRDRKCEVACPKDLYIDKNNRLCLEKCVDGMFIDSSTKECIYTCGLKLIDGNTLQCIEFCATDRYIDKAANTCIDKCKPGYYIYVGVVNNECLETCGTYFLNEKTNECVRSCPNDTLADAFNNHCVDNCPENTYFFTYNNRKECVESCGLYGQFSDKKTKKCYEKCPDGLYTQKSTRECIDSCGDLYEDDVLKHCANFCEPNRYSILQKKKCVTSCADYSLYTNDLTRTCDSNCPRGLIGDPLTYQCKSLIDSIGNGNANSNVNGNLGDNINDIIKDTPIINNDNETIQFVNTSKESLEEGKNCSKNTSSIDLGECETKLKEYYNISKEEPLLIMKVDKKTDPTKPTNTIDYSVYTIKGVKLDLKHCDDTPIEIKIPIKDASSPEFEKAKNFFEKGIDINNISDPFFTDICIPYTSENGTDIPLEDRKKLIYQDQSELMCQKGCEYQGIDYETQTVKCKCVASESSTGEKKTALENTFSDIADELLSILTQSNYVVSKCFITAFQSNSILKNLGAYFCIVLIVVDSSYLVFFFYNGTNPIKLYIIKEFKDVLNPTPTGSITIAVPPKKEKKVSIKSLQKNSIANNNDRQQSKLSSSRKKTSSMYSSSREFFADHKVLKNIEEYSSNDLNQMAFKDATIYDNRTFFIFYWEFLEKAHPLIETFMVKNSKELTSLKYLHFFLSIFMDFAFSALFYSGKFISNANQNDNSSDFWFELPISLYTYLFGSVINFLLNKLSSSESGLEAIKEKKDKQEKINAIRTFINCYIIRIYIYIAIHMVLVLLFSYFIIMFCSVYKNSQDNWILSGLTSTGMSFVMPLAFALLFSSLKSLSLWAKSVFLFKIAEILAYVFS